MGRIVTQVRIRNLLDEGNVISCDALVDTGAAYMVLPKVCGPYRALMTGDLEPKAAPREDAGLALGYNMGALRAPDRPAQA